MTATVPTASATAELLGWVRCACGVFRVYAVAGKLAQDRRIAGQCLTRAALGDGWLLYPQTGTWQCCSCCDASPPSDAFTWAIEARAKYLGQGLAA